MKKTFFIVCTGLLGLTIISFLITTGQAVASPSSPTDYRITALVVDSRHQDTVYAGTPSGLFRTTDGGAVWKAIGEFSVNAIVLDPLSSDVIYLGTDRGVFRSEDGGRSWSLASRGLSSSLVYTLALDPTGSGMLYAGTEAGVFQSSDKGNTWTPINQGLTGPPIVWDLKVDPLSSEKLYAVTSAGVFRTDNRGVVWKFVSERGRIGSAYAWYRAIGIHSKKSTIIYLAASTRGSVWLFRSTDGGETWKALKSGLPQSPTYPSLTYPSLALDSSDTSRAYVGHDTEGVFRSTDKGETWEPSHQGMPLRAVRALAIDPTRPNILYAGTDGGGVYKTTDSGATWQPVNTGLIEVVILYGQVTDLENRPLSNVDLYAYESGVAGRTGRARTGTDGSYTMALFPGTYNVMVSFPAARGLSTQTFSEIEVLKDTKRDFAAESTVTLSGTILDPDGLPVNLASLQITDAKTGATAAQYPHASFDGHYQVSVRPGVYNLYVDPPPGSRLLPQTVFGVVVVRDTTVDITLERGLLLSGRVTDPDGKPVANAYIYAQDMMSGRFTGYAQTSSDGLYLFALRPGIYYFLDIQPPEGSGLARKTIQNVGISADTILDITLERGLILSGRITDPDGKPVVNASIYAQDPTSGQSGSGQTSSYGVYRITLPAGTYTLDISPPMESNLPRKTMKGIRIGTDTTLDIILERGIILSGRIADPAGKPVVNASIYAQDPTFNQSGHGWTSSDGSYRIALLPGTYRLDVQPMMESGLLSKTIKDLRISVDTTLDITLERGLILSGRITYPEGKPVANVSINAWDPISNRSGWDQTSFDGSYQMTLAPGTYTLYIQPPTESVLPQKTMKGIQISTDTTLDISLEAGIILSGRITDPGGKLVAKIFISASSPTSGQSGGGWISSDGSYRISLIPGTYTLTVSPPIDSKWPYQVITDVQVMEDRTFDITLKPGYVLSGRITGSQGEPVVELGLFALDRLRGQSGWGQVSVDGTYRIVLLPGNYELWLYLPTGHQMIADVEIMEDMSLDITLKAMVTVSGRVTDSEGRGLTDVEVAAFEDACRPIVGLELGTTTTALDGTYSLMLPVGTYDLRFGKNIQDFPGLLAGCLRINNKVTDNMTLNVVLPSLGEIFVLSGRITDEMDQGVSEVSVTAYDSINGNMATGFSGEDGMYRLNLSAGTYELTFFTSSLSSLRLGYPFTETCIKALLISRDTIRDIRLSFSRPTVVEQASEASGLPKTFALYQNAPNPFNAQTRIGYQLPKVCRVSLTIYNMLGQRVKTLVDERKVPGWYTVVWDGTDETGRNVASGVYMYRLEMLGQGFVDVKRMMLIR